MNLSFCSQLSKRRPSGECSAVSHVSPQDCLHTLVFFLALCTTLFPAVPASAQTASASASPAKNETSPAAPVASVNLKMPQFDVAVNPTSNKIYVIGVQNVDVIDGATNASIPIPVKTVWTDFTVRTALNPVANKLYVTNDGSHSVWVIDGAGNQATIIKIDHEREPYGVAVNVKTNKVYVTDVGSNSVSVIDGASNGVTSFGVGRAPTAVAVNPVTNKIYVANSASNNVTVIDGATNATSTVAAGKTPVAVAVNTVTNRIYVCNSLGDTVTVINGADNATSTVAT